MMDYGDMKGYGKNSHGMNGMKVKAKPHGHNVHDGYCKTNKVDTLAVAKSVVRSAKPSPATPSEPAAMDVVLL